MSDIRFYIPKGETIPTDLELYVDDVYVRYERVKNGIERQTIVTWYTPEERMPEEGIYVVVTYSGHSKNVTYDHALGIAEWYNDGFGWFVEGLPEDAEFTIHVWADLEPYGGGAYYADNCSLIGI